MESMSTRDSGFSGRLPCGRRLQVRLGSCQSKDVRPLPPAVMAPLAARFAIERGLELPDRRIPRAPDRIKRDASLGLAPMALHLKEAVPAVEALGDGWRGLRRPAIALHTQGPCMGLRAIGLTDGLYSSACSALILAAEMRPPPDDFARLGGAHGLDYSSRNKARQFH